MSFGWFAHGWNVSSGAFPVVGADENVCNVGALLGFEVTSHMWFVALRFPARE